VSLPDSAEIERKFYSYQRLGLLSGLAVRDVTEDRFGKITEGVMADHCHKTNSRNPTAEDYAGLLHQSM